MKKSVLFVEDNAIAQTLIAEVFGSEYQIDIVGDYVAAMEKLSQVQYELVITDIFFPQESGSGKKDLAGELAERIRSFCWREGTEHFSSLIEYLLGEEKDIRAYQDEDPEYAFETAQSAAHELSWPLDRLQDTIKAINSWLSSQDEADQPLGILVAEECERRDLRFKMASSLFHHNNKLEAVNQFVNSKKWPDIFDYGHRGSSGEELENPKESRIFWEELRKEVMKGSA